MNDQGTQHPSEPQGTPTGQPDAAGPGDAGQPADTSTVAAHPDMSEADRLRAQADAFRKQAEQAKADHRHATTKITELGTSSADLRRALAEKDREIQRLQQSASQRPSQVDEYDDLPRGDSITPGAIEAALRNTDLYNANVEMAQRILEMGGKFAQIERREAVDGYVREFGISADDASRIMDYRDAGLHADADRLLLSVRTAAQSRDGRLEQREAQRLAAQQMVDGSTAATPPAAAEVDEVLGNVETPEERRRAVTSLLSSGDRGKISDWLKRPIGRGKQA